MKITSLDRRFWMHDKASHRLRFEDWHEYNLICHELSSAYGQGFYVVKYHRPNIRTTAQWWMVVHSSRGSSPPDIYLTEESQLSYLILKGIRVECRNDFNSKYTTTD